MLCITESQQKMDNNIFSESIKYETSMRKQSDIKGGGLMILYKGNSFKIEKKICKHPDLMMINCKYETIKFHLLLTYMSTNDFEKNRKMYEEMKEKITEGELETIIAGDFNGHIRILGAQKINKNRSLLNNFIEENNLVILNMEEECEGETTWEARNQRSVIDYILVNKKMYERFQNMKIDEDKQQFDISDHNLLTAYFKIKMKELYKQKSEEVITYYKINDETTKEYIRMMEEKMKSDKPKTSSGQ